MKLITIIFGVFVYMILRLFIGLAGQTGPMEHLLGRFYAYWAMAIIDTLKSATFAYLSGLFSVFLTGAIFNLVAPNMFQAFVWPLVCISAIIGIFRTLFAPDAGITYFEGVATTILSTFTTYLGVVHGFKIIT